jgi:hypothetical protein
VSSKRPFARQHLRKPAPGVARARVVAAEFLDEFGVGSDRTIAAFDLGLARGNPRRRLLVGSKGRLGVVVAVHDNLPGSGTWRASYPATTAPATEFHSAGRRPGEPGRVTTPVAVSVTVSHNRSHAGGRLTLPQQEEHAGPTTAPTIDAARLEPRASIPGSVDWSAVVGPSSGKPEADSQQHPAKSDQKTSEDIVRGARQGVIAALTRRAIDWLWDHVPH